MESYGGMLLTGETEELGKNLSPWNFVHHKSTTSTDPGDNTGISCKRPATNRLSHDTAFSSF
jgi:hypothetical protein